MVGQPGRLVVDVPDLRHDSPSMEAAGGQCSHASGDAAQSQRCCFLALGSKPRDDLAYGDRQPIQLRVPRHVRSGEQGALGRSEEHTSELQSLMRISYAVFCLKKKKKKEIYTTYNRY